VVLAGRRVPEPAHRLALDLDRAELARREPEVIDDDGRPSADRDPWR
jgi:hypothetical protein